MADPRAIEAAVCRLINSVVERNDATGFYSCRICGGASLSRVDMAHGPSCPCTDGLEALAAQPQETPEQKGRMPFKLWTNGDGYLYREYADGRVERTVAPQKAGELGEQVRDFDDVPSLHGVVKEHFLGAQKTMPDAEGLIKRLREQHDALNCMALPGGFKSDESKRHEIETAMTLVWQAADALTAANEKTETLRTALQTALTREAATTARHDAKVETIKAETVAKCVDAIHEAGRGYLGNAAKRWAFMHAESVVRALSPTAPVTKGAGQ